jgi:hypothetical protein
MSSGGPPDPPPLPDGYRPGDRVRVADGLLARMVGVVLGPAADFRWQPAILVRFRIWGRDMDVPFVVPPGHVISRLEPVPPAD